MEDDETVVRTGPAPGLGGPPRRKTPPLAPSSSSAAPRKPRSRSHTIAYPRQDADGNAHHLPPDASIVSLFGKSPPSSSPFSATQPLASSVPGGTSPPSSSSSILTLLGISPKGTNNATRMLSTSSSTSSATSSATTSPLTNTTTLPLPVPLPSPSSSVTSGDEFPEAITPPQQFIGIISSPGGVTTDTIKEDRHHLHHHHHHGEEKEEKGHPSSSLLSSSAPAHSHAIHPRAPSSGHSYSHKPRMPALHLAVEDDYDTDTDDQDTFSDSTLRNEGPRGHAPYYKSWNANANASRPTGSAATGGEAEKSPYYLGVAPGGPPGAGQQHHRRASWSPAPLFRSTNTAATTIPISEHASNHHHSNSVGSPSSPPSSGGPGVSILSWLNGQNNPSPAAPHQGAHGLGNSTASEDSPVGLFRRLSLSANRRPVVPAPPSTISTSEISEDAERLGRPLSKVKSPPPRKLSPMGERMLRAHYDSFS